MTTRNEIRPESLRPASDAPPPPTPEKASLIEDYIDILYAPARVFARRAQSGFGMHLLIISLLTAVLMFVNRGVFEQIFDAQYTARIPEMLAKNPQLTAEQIEQGRGIARGVASIANYVFPPIVILLFSLVVWVGSLVAGARLSLKQSALVSTLASIPRLLGLLAITIQVAFMDTTSVTHMGQLTVGPARFMDPGATARKMYNLATGFDAFAIWGAVLVGIGVAVIGRVSGAKAAIAATVYFVLGTALVLLQ